MYARDLVCHHRSVARAGSRTLTPLRVRVGPLTAPGSAGRSSFPWLSRWKTHLYLADADINGLFKIPKDFNCRNSLKFKALIGFSCS